MKRLVAILIALLAFAASAAPAFADEVYTSVSVQAYGDVKIENLADVGARDTSEAHNTTYSVDGSRTISFESQPAGVGNYYYRITDVSSAPGVTPDAREYILWLSVTYDARDTTKTIRGMVLQEDTRNSIHAEEELAAATNSGYISKPENVRFVTTKRETVALEREITYTERSAAGAKVANSRTQKVVLERRLQVDGRDGTLLRDKAGKLISVADDGSTSSTLWRIASLQTDPASDATGTPAEIMAAAYGGRAAVAKMVKSPAYSKNGVAWTPDRASVPAWVVDLNDTSLDPAHPPAKIFERVIYTPGDSPDPGPEPGPEPGPQPGPDPGPEPGPEPGPDPGPQPDPDPEPGPDPGPNPDPEPSPDPKPNPTPEPSPGPSPSPNPGPSPSPSTDPSPSKGGTPSPSQTTPVERVIKSVLPTTGDPASFIPLGALAIASAGILILAATRKRKE